MTRSINHAWLADVEGGGREPCVVNQRCMPPTTCRPPSHQPCRKSFAPNAGLAVETIQKKDSQI